MTCGRAATALYLQDMTILACTRSTMPYGENLHHTNTTNTSHAEHAASTVQHPHCPGHFTSSAMLHMCRDLIASKEQGSVQCSSTTYTHIFCRCIRTSLLVRPLILHKELRDQLPSPGSKRGLMTLELDASHASSLKLGPI